MNRMRKALSLVIATGLGTLSTGCADDPQQTPLQHPNEEVGRIAMSLETTSNLGNRFRLRQAVFLVDRSSRSSGGFFGGGTGGLLGGLFGDSGIITLPASDGGVGFLTDSSNTPQVSPFTEASADIPVEVPLTIFDGGIFFSDGGVVFPPDLFGPQTFSRELSIDSEDNPLAPEIRKEVPAGDYRIFLQNGWFLERVDGDSAFEVAATLVGSATQTTSVFSKQDSVVSYTFNTNGEIVSFVPRGGIVIRPTVIETRTDASVPPQADFGAVIELNRSALSDFTLREALGSIAKNASLPENPELLYRSLIDSFASAGKGLLPSAHHCGDETTNGAPSLNGFPITCDRLEAQQFDNLDAWFPIAAVNRLDLAPLDGANCGQQRMIFANNIALGNGRMFMILESQIPNPHPECGVDACAPLAQAWNDLSTQDSGTRNKLLHEMFFSGSPTLSAAGFGPFLSANTMTVGSGQIRTNSFNSDPWTLREFKVVANETRTEAMAVPFPVSEAPRGELWNDAVPSAVGDACRQNFLKALDGLLTDDLARMRFIVDDACKDAESQNDGRSEDYASHLKEGTGVFAEAIARRIQGTGLTPTDIANRARFGGSCMGCHQEASGTSLGNNVSAPFAFDFPQVLEATEACADGSFNCSGISPALREVFLPRRLAAQEALLARGGCGFGAVDGGPGFPDASVPSVDGGVGFPGILDASVDTTDGGVTTGDGGFASGFSDGGTTPRGTQAGNASLPALAAGASVRSLVQADGRARSRLSGLTLGGQPAGSTH